MTSERSRRRARKFKPAPTTPEALEELWRQHGPEALRTVARLDPSAFLLAIARLIDDVD